MISLDLQKTLHTAAGELSLQLQLEIPQGQFLAIYGPTGVGKTTLLRMLAGLTRPDAGSLVVEGVHWYDGKQKINQSPQKRDAALLFQDYALFPHLTVRQNIAFAKPAGVGAALVEELIGVMELEQLAGQKPARLSGGQQQRVALARALAQQPRLLLLDEPLAAQDGGMRLKLQQYIRQAHAQYGFTTLLVSHSLAEVYKLADQVCILETGHISRQGSPEQVFRNEQLSAKFSLQGELIAQQQGEFHTILTVLIEQKLVKVLVTTEVAAGLQLGDAVLVSSKAFNPIIQKIS